jgi:acyl carrier protein
MKTMPIHVLQSSPPSRRFANPLLSRAGLLSLSRWTCRYTSIRALVILTALSWCFLFCGGCGPQQSQPTVDRVRAEVAKILKKDAAQIDPLKPLMSQGADELDIVEIVMAVEETFKIEIPDTAISGEKTGEVSKGLTVQKLAEIVSSQKKTK